MFRTSLKIPPIVRAHLQPHGLTGVQNKHYDMYEFMAKKREALQLLEHFLSAVGVFHRTAAPYEHAASSAVSLAHAAHTATITAVASQASAG